MITRCIHVLLFWLSYCHFALFAPLTVSDNLSYHFIKKDEWASVPTIRDVYIKSDGASIPQVFHSIELKNKVQDKKRTVTGNEFEKKALSKKRYVLKKTPLERGLWGKRQMLLPSSPVMNTIPRYYKKPIRLGKEIYLTRVQNGNERFLSDPLQKGLWGKRNILIFPVPVKKSDRNFKDEKRSYKYQNNGAMIDISADSIGPIEKGLWGKRDGIDADLNSVIYLHEPNDINRVRDMRNTYRSGEDVFHKRGLGKRYVLLEKSANQFPRIQSGESKERRITPLQKGLWGKRNAQQLRSYNALLNSKMIRSIDNYRSIDKVGKNLSRKRFLNERYLG